MHRPIKIGSGQYWLIIDGGHKMGLFDKHQMSRISFRGFEPAQLLTISFPQRRLHGCKWEWSTGFHFGGFLLIIIFLRYNVDLFHFGFYLVYAIHLFDSFLSRYCQNEFERHFSGLDRNGCRELVYTHLYTQHINIETKRMAMRSSSSSSEEWNKCDKKVAP